MRNKLVASLIILSGCGVSSESSRAVQGRLASANTQAIVASTTRTGRQSVTDVSRDGLFRLQVPTDEPVQLVVAERSATGTFEIRRLIGPRWFTLRRGATLDLGVVRALNETVSQSTAAGTAVHSCPSDSAHQGRADLPYDAKLSVGQTWKLGDAFAEKGSQPAAIVNVTMEGTPWHLEALKTNTVFTVTQADCSHQGNRDQGRDRVFVTWKNTDGSTETDHLDLRYCDGGRSSGGSGVLPVDDDDDSEEVREADEIECEHVDIEGCSAERSSCDRDDELVPAEGVVDVCSSDDNSPQEGGGMTGGAGSGAGGGAGGGTSENSADGGTPPPEIG
ncbi:MAG: hypothetical protein K1X64_05565 [Myxococcaceae bacterium]|nr:hypothetical protein [Myxococcaceae bacterium]